MQSLAANDLAIALISGLGRFDFQDRLADSLKRYIPVEASLILLYRKDTTPQILFNDWKNRKGLTDIKSYLDGPYRHDPFYKLAQNDSEDGLYGLSQIAPNDFSHSQYYKKYYQFSGLWDEFNYIISLNDEVRIAISISRSLSSPKFSPCDVALLRDVMPVVQSAVVRHWRDLRPEVLNHDTPRLRHALAEAVKNFGSSVLTERECEIAQLVLRGYSLKGAAEMLGISPATVKLHRRNLYAKLDVSSQAELFSLFIDAVSEAPNHFEDPLTGYLPEPSILYQS